MMLFGSSTKAASRLCCTRQALSRLVNGKAGISPAIALALERIGWSNASFRMRLQASYELAQMPVGKVSVARRGPVPTIAEQFGDQGADSRRRRQAPWNVALAEPRAPDMANGRVMDKGAFHGE